MPQQSIQQRVVDACGAIVSNEVGLAEMRMTRLSAYPEQSLRTKNLCNRNRLGVSRFMIVFIAIAHVSMLGEGGLWASQIKTLDTEWRSLLK